MKQKNMNKYYSGLSKNNSKRINKAKKNVIKARTKIKKITNSNI